MLKKIALLGIFITSSLQAHNPGVICFMHQHISPSSASASSSTEQHKKFSGASFVTGLLTSLQKTIVSFSNNAFNESNRKK